MKYPFALLLIASLFSTIAQAENQSPNFIVIFTDDQGYQDIGVFGSPKIKTPHLDQMAAEGMKFTDFYVSSPVCSASRSALLTGCYNTRVSIQGALFPNRGYKGLNPDEITIAEVLKTKGYSTACIGKWHLGDDEPFLPTRQGFDMYYGIPYSNDMSVNPNMKVADDINWREGMTLKAMREGKPIKNKVPLLRDDEVIEYPVDQSTITKRYTEEAIKFINANQAKPFFIYLPHTMPHTPLFASPEFKGKSERGLYGDVIEEIDWSVGQILQTLKEKGLDKNTLVIFTSDNGPWLVKKENGGSALPLRDGKRSFYEGGMREPCIMWWPGKMPAGQICDKIASTIDFLPTFASYAGAEVPSDRKIDGVDISGLIEGKPDANPREFMFYHTTAVRRGPWKLMKQKGGTALYNLEEDISETKDQSADHPEIVQQLDKLLADHAADLKANSRPAGVFKPGPGYIKPPARQKKPKKGKKK